MSINCPTIYFMNGDQIEQDKDTLEERIEKETAVLYIHKQMGDSLTRVLVREKNWPELKRKMILITTDNKIKYVKILK